MSTYTTYKIKKEPNRTKLFHFHRLSDNFPRVKQFRLNAELGGSGTQNHPACIRNCGGTSGSIWCSWG